ncbi:hypothetical protein BJV78DRAFT_44131 [Lactifluus subvellereus]|nr:hypothetical protein BJV78DRAFT_44131 [Lactifluus subvellereus]
MVAASPTPSFPGAWPDWSSTDIAPPLPEKYIPTDTLETDDAPQDTSPSLLCLSPRPLPELPSLSSSLSTADSSITNDSPALPEPPCPPAEVLPACASPLTHSPVILDLPEPRSPDSAHFSPANGSISFRSPASSQLRLSLSNNCPGARSTESIATYLPSPSSPHSPDAEHAARQDEESSPNPSGEESTNPCPRSDPQEHSQHAAKVPIGKRTFLNRVKRIGGRVRKLFKARVVETKTRRNSVSPLVSPRKLPIPVSVRLPAAVPDSPTSRQGSELPHSLPRRFSLQSLLHSRLPRESADSGLRATTGNRLSTVISAHDEDWSSLDNTRLPDVADAPGTVQPEAQLDKDQHERKTEGRVPLTSEVPHGPGVGVAEPTSVATNPDLA